MGLRARIADRLDTGAGRTVLSCLLVLVILTPAFIWRLPGLMLVFGAAFGFFGGYNFARWEWRRRGYVPKYDDIATPGETINAPPRQNLRRR